MKIIYLDCSSGIAGDMFVAACIDLGVPYDYLEKVISKLSLTNYKIELSETKRHNIIAKLFRVLTNENHSHRTYKQIVELLQMGLPAALFSKTLKILDILAEAEALVHKQNKDEVTFHELGAVDTIIDIAAAAACLDYLNPEQVVVSPINLGHGQITMHHGVFAVPAPATANICRGLRVYAGNQPFELTTPTGAAIVKASISQIGHLPDMTLIATGRGAGSMEIEGLPNFLTIYQGTLKQGDFTGSDEVLVINANIDDMPPLFFEELHSSLLSAGALDVTLSSVLMKKMRLAWQIEILCPCELRLTIEEILFTRTTTIGLRYYLVKRTIAKRQTQVIKTSYGEVQVKAAYYNGKLVNLQPEYNDIRMLAEASPLSIKQLYQAITAEIWQNFNKSHES